MKHLKIYENYLKKLSFSELIDTLVSVCYYLENTLPVKTVVYYDADNIDPATFYCETTNIENYNKLYDFIKTNNITIVKTYNELKKK